MQCPKVKLCLFNTPPYSPGSEILAVGPAFFRCRGGAAFGVQPISFPPGKNVQVLVPDVLVDGPTITSTNDCHRPHENSTVVT